MHPTVKNARVAGALYVLLGNHRCCPPDLHSQQADREWERECLLAKGLIPHGLQMENGLLIRSSGCEVPNCLSGRNREQSQ